MEKPEIAHANMIQVINPPPPPSSIFLEQVITNRMQNLKNFIRHGKQARDRSPENQAGHFYSPTGTAEQQYHQYSAPVQATQQPIYATQQQQQHSKQQTEYNEAAAKIVAEEREARSRLPRYPGLERFKLLDKMGEYDFVLRLC